jgi:diguanylate cyclase (GGDEF)-like protein/PAS domain S-box-containing protein
MDDPRRVTSVYSAVDAVGGAPDRESLLASALDAIVSIDAAGRVVEFNPSAERTFGYTREEAIGRTLGDLIVPESLRDSHAAGVARVAAGDPARLIGKRLELPAMRADGAEIPIELTITQTLCDPFMVTAFVRDLTERNQTQQALRDSEERFAHAFVQAPVGIVLFDLTPESAGLMTRANDALCAMTGHSEAELIGRPVQTIGHPDDHETTTALFREVLAGARSRLEAERRFVRADGSTLWALVHATVARSADGSPIYGIAQLLDVTDRHRAAEQAADLRRDNEQILNAAGDGIYRTDTEGLLTFVNPAGAELLGYEPPELVGRRIHDLIHHTHPDGTPHPQSDCPAARTARDGVVRRLEDDVFWHKDGTPITVHYTSTPMRVDGRPAGAVVVFSDVTERREMEAQLRHLADFDALTGLINRRRFEEALAAELETAEGSGALLLVDLDHFKFVNDSFGHAAGDDLIRAVATVLADRLRDGDELARVGGDEFAVLLRRADPAEAATIAARLLAGIERARPRGLSVSASIGATSFAADECTTAGDLLVAADIALYQAKDAGRGRTAFYSGAAGASLTWVERIRSALEQDRLVVHSQPIVDLRTGQTVHEELLVRMLDEDGGVIPPSSFLPTAESFGLVGDIDRWVLRQAVELAAHGRPVNVNLSGQSIGRIDLLDDFEGWLADSGARPSDIVVELTETLAVANLAQAGTFAERIRGLGCGLALDDFGTGFGSFTYLRRLPADFLKIDMEFVRDLTSDEDNRRVVDAIVDVARRFGLTTIAEGVEDEATLAILREAGVDCAQGFHLGRPAPVRL